MNIVRLEKLVLILLGVSFFIGIWHAFPMLNVVKDESYFVGGALRAMESYSLLPQINDVPYGTLTYFLNYFLIGASLLFLLPLFKFNVLNLKLFLIESPQIIYIIPRILSAMLGLVFLFLVYKIIKSEFPEIKTRLFLIILLFTNIITAVILHTGKMWVLSTLLVLISFYYLSKALERKLPQDIFLTTLFAFLAFANLPLNGYALINLPILLFSFRKDRDLIYKILKYALIGFGIYLATTLLNFEGVKNQVLSIYQDYLFSPEESSRNLNFLQSLALNSKKFFALFPLLLLTLILTAKNGVKNKILFRNSFVYSAIYFLLIALTVRWVNDFRMALRYLFPLGFFLIFLIASFDIKFKKIFYLIGGISAIYFVFILYYLSAPTTYNNAYNWVLKNLNKENVMIVNRVDELQLPENKKSALLLQDEYCATKCRGIIEHDLNSYFKPLVISGRAKPEKIEEAIVSDDKVIYYFEEAEKNFPDRKLVAIFKNNVGDNDYFSVDYKLGTYFDLSYFKLKNLGKNIYVYK